MIPQNDTIAAIATPIGEGGIAVIRISGPDAIEIGDKGFRGKHGAWGLGKKHKLIAF